MTEERVIQVKVTSKPSQRYGFPAKWYPDRVRTDSWGDTWHLLEFFDGYRCWFPRDEFEELGQ